MTADQFDALAALIKLQASASREAARLVLIDGQTVTLRLREEGNAGRDRSLA